MTAVATGVIQSRNPATDHVVFTAPAATAGVDAAVERAYAAQETWARRPLPERQALLRRSAELAERAAPRLAGLIVAEMGKLHRDADLPVVHLDSNAPCTTPTETASPPTCGASPIPTMATR